MTPAGHAPTTNDLLGCGIADPGRRRAAGIRKDRVRDQAVLARWMLARTWNARAPWSWVAGDEVYGADPGWWLTWRNGKPVTCSPAACRHKFSVGLVTFRADELAVLRLREHGKRNSAGAGAKGDCYYDWAYVLPAQPGNHRPRICWNRRTK